MTPALSKRRPPCLRAAIALAAIRTRAHSNKVLSIDKIIRIRALGEVIPDPSSTSMSIGEWDAMIHVQVGWVGINSTGIFVAPPPRDDSAAARIKRWGDQRFIDEHFLPSILAITIFVHPMLPIGANVSWYFGWKNVCWRSGSAAARNSEQRECEDRSFHAAV